MSSWFVLRDETSLTSRAVACCFLYGKIVSEARRIPSASCLGRYFTRLHFSQIVEFGGYKQYLCSFLISHVLVVSRAHTSSDYFVQVHRHECLFCYSTLSRPIKARSKQAWSIGISDIIVDSSQSRKLEPPAAGVVFIL